MSIHRYLSVYTICGFPWIASKKPPGPLPPLSLRRCPSDADRSRAREGAAPGRGTKSPGIWGSGYYIIVVKLKSQVK